MKATSEPIRYRESLFDDVQLPTLITPKRLKAPAEEARESPVTVPPDGVSADNRRSARWSRGDTCRSRGACRSVEVADLQHHLGSFRRQPGGRSARSGALACRVSLLALPQTPVARPDQSRRCVP